MRGRWDRVRERAGDLGRDEDGDFDELDWDIVLVGAGGYVMFCTGSNREAS
jgi:hypothetical protein